MHIFFQLFYFICANALNNLLLRKDMCHWSKGMQMRWALILIRHNILTHLQGSIKTVGCLYRYNLSHLEQWLRDNKLQETPCQEALEPIIQASQLLQARKTDADVESICEMCSRLSTSQVTNLLLRHILF